MKQLNDQKGQALIELIIFLPIMFMLYSLISGFVGAINGSINQQKVTRGYFYYRVQNNSTIPKPDENNSFNNWEQFGMFFIGWKEYFGAGDTPVQPCYKMSIPLKAAANDKCEDKYAKETSQYIRVGTVYGICGTTYLRGPGAPVFMPDMQGTDFRFLVERSSCLIQ